MCNLQESEWCADLPNEVHNTVYFERPGAQNTAETLRLAKERARKSEIRNIVVASNTGDTGATASEIFENFNLIVVTSVFGYKEPNFQRLLPKNREIIEKNGGKIVTAAHAFGTLGRAVHNKFGAIQVDEIIANVLRLFGEGVKVACEVVCMATDAGLIRTNEEAIGIAGSGGGADAALVLKPSNTHTFFDTKVREIICKPRL
jgi:hypothetical protein